MSRKPPLLALLGCAMVIATADAGAHTSLTKGSGAKPVTKLKLMRSPYGRVLFANGYAAYLFTRDTAQSECYGQCAEAWPPLEPAGELAAGRGVREGCSAPSRATTAASR